MGIQHGRRRETYTARGRPANRNSHGKITGKNQRKNGTALAEYDMKQQANAVLSVDFVLFLDL
jgi:hypothetical protein